LTDFEALATSCPARLLPQGWRDPCRPRSARDGQEVRQL